MASFEGQPEPCDRSAWRRAAILRLATSDEDRIGNPRWRWSGQVLDSWTACFALFFRGHQKCRRLSWRSAVGEHDGVSSAGTGRSYWLIVCSAKRLQRIESHQRNGRKSMGDHNEDATTVSPSRRALAGLGGAGLVARRGGGAQGLLPDFARARRARALRIAELAPRAGIAPASSSRAAWCSRLDRGIGDLRTRRPVDRGRQESARCGAGLSRFSGDDTAVIDARQPDRAPRLNRYPPSLLSGGCCAASSPTGLLNPRLPAGTLATTLTPGLSPRRRLCRACWVTGARHDSTMGTTTGGRHVAGLAHAGAQRCLRPRAARNPACVLVFAYWRGFGTPTRNTRRNIRPACEKPISAHRNQLAHPRPWGRCSMQKSSAMPARSACGRSRHGVSKQTHGSAHVLELGRAGPVCGPG